MKQPVPPMALKCEESYLLDGELICKLTCEPCHSVCWNCKKI